jgi:molybdopterin-synthase adenylyltransferase
VAGTIGSIQAIEAIKYLVGFEEGLLINRLLTYDSRSMKFHQVEVTKDPDCKACNRTTESTEPVSSEFI